MTSKPTVLVVAPTPTIAAAVFAWLTDAGCSVIVVDSFLSAKQHLDRDMCLLISEVRLGEYNGLHLALRAQVRGIPAILIGESDPVLQSEAKQLDAVYLPLDLDLQRLLSVVNAIFEVARPAERSWRGATTDVSFISSSKSGGAIVEARQSIQAVRRRTLLS